MIFARLLKMYFIIFKWYVRTLKRRKDMSIIEVNNLTRDFDYYEKISGLKGSVKNLFKRKKMIKHAVKDISFSIEESEIVGFIGPNGTI